MDKIDIQNVKTAIEFLKGDKYVPTDKLVFFMYCSKHGTVHSSLKRSKGCFADFLKNFPMKPAMDITIA